MVSHLDMLLGGVEHVGDAVGLQVRHVLDGLPIPNMDPIIHLCSQSDGSKFSQVSGVGERPCHS